jgi:hypothetical protein
MADRPAIVCEFSPSVPVAVSWIDHGDRAGPEVSRARGETKNHGHLYILNVIILVSENINTKYYSIYYIKKIEHNSLMMVYQYYSCQLS